MPKAPTDNISFAAKIVAALGNLRRSTDLNPDSRHNEGRFLSEAYFWDTVADYASKQAEKAWKAMEENNIIPDDEARKDRKRLAVGEHVLSESPRFVCRAVVTKPVRRFDVMELAKILAKKHKVPVPSTVEYYEEAKKETTSQVRLAVEEKGV